MNVTCYLLYVCASDVVLECMGSQWEFQCPHFTKSGTLANLHMAARQQRVKLQQERTGGKFKCSSVFIPSQKWVI